MNTAMDEFYTQMKSIIEDFEKDSYTQFNLQLQDPGILPYYFPNMFAEGLAPVNSPWTMISK